MSELPPLKPTIETTSTGFLLGKRLRQKLSISVTTAALVSEAVHAMVGELLLLLPKRSKINEIEVEFFGPTDVLRYASAVLGSAMESQPILRQWLFEEVSQYSVNFEDPETGWLQGFEYCTRDGQRMQLHIEPSSDSDFPQSEPTLSPTGEPPPLVAEDDDPEFIAATEEARRRLPEFLHFLKSPQAGVTVRVPYHRQGVRELHDAALVGKKGEELTVEISLNDADPPIRANYKLTEIEDWTVLHANGQRTGGYTTRVMLRKARAHYGGMLPSQLQALEQSFSDMMDAERYGPKGEA